ncbi:MAG: sensor histidine kinase [Planctomycetota bacterium]|jgi:PAS domain S-box-containing protein
MVRLNLRTKIMICCIGLVALLDFMVVIFIRSQLSGVLRAKYLATGHTMTVNLAARSEHFMLTEDFVSLLQLVKNLKDSDEDIAYAYVSDRKGRALAHTFARGFPADLVGVNNPGPGDTWKQELLDTVEEGLVHDIAVPVLQGKVGSVHVGISERRIQRTISHFTLGLVGIAGFVLLVAVGLAAVVSWVVTQPVRNLIEAARKIRDGELGQQVVASTKDEIGDLVESFNQMSDELLKQHRVLEDRNRRIRTTQEQAAWERDKLRAIIDSMVEGVIFVDDNGRISLCNESAERIWNTCAGELLGKSVQECSSAELRSKLGGILEQAKQKSGFITTDSLELRNGRYLASYSTVHGEQGRYLGLVFLSLDISERVELEQEHKRLRDQLFQQEKMVLIGQIAASVAHELNTPLGTVLLRSQLMQQQVGDGGDSSDLDVIESEARRCRGIIDSLLGFSRRSEGMMSRTDVGSLIKESLTLIKNDLANKGISVQNEYGDKEVIIWADGNQIQQVLLNLVTNAADAMPDGGRLEIRTRFCEDFVEIRVTDNGWGMEEDVLKRAFDPFFTTKGRGKGTGLGLAVCQRIVEEHGGEIQIQSQPGHGTTVSVRLPHTPLEVAADE